MIKLTTSEKSQIRGLISSPQWETIVRAAELLIQQMRNESSLTDSEWGTISSILLKEGRTQGIERFFQELNEQLQS